MIVKNTKNLRVLGKGKTALAIKNIYPNTILYDDKDFESYDKNSLEFTIVSPGITPFNDMVKNSKNIISDYDLFLTNEEFQHKKDIFSIWISGTNGKTTTTQMCEHLLDKTNFIACGNIGLPLADAISQNYTKLIIESSSYTLHYTAYAKPNIYMLLPISDDHLSWHQSFENYENAKLKPLKNMSKNDIAIIPYKYKDINSSAKIITYKDSKDLANKMDIDIGKIDFKEPFLFDALLSMSLDKILNNNINYNKINSFKTDLHKMEEFYKKDNILYVNDSKATNVDATIQALKTYKSNIIHIILGGDDKGANLKPLFEELKKHQIYIYSIGTNTQKLYNLSIQYNLKCVKCYNLLEAINNIKKNIKNHNNTNMVVLLSPSASSYDQFDSYIQRGDIFKDNILS
jgi:UDP-N-acetylmuramoylalanine--D-glutamate ligase